VQKVGLKWWKRIQRVSYLGFLFTSAHAFAFQALESREVLWIIVVLLITLLVLFGQASGIASVKKGRAKRLPKVAHTDIKI
jgi:DMSO/TMAO reductase YedYZ heme-binding membrane subunit